MSSLIIFMMCLVSHDLREIRAKVLFGASLHRQAWIPPRERVSP
jgi:hypothetical protein